MSNPLDSDVEAVLLRTRDLWEELRGARLFITGGTGFFGCWLLESLLWANDRLSLGVQATVLTRSKAAFERKAAHLAGHPIVRLVEGDVRSFAFPPGEFSHVIHAATEASARLNVEDPFTMFDAVVTGTRRVLDFTVQCGAKKFLLTSSGAIYGRQPAELTHVPEEYTGGPDPFDVTAAYGEGKRATETMCRTYAVKHGIETKILRGFTFVGPYLPLRIHYAIGNFVADVLQGKPIEVRGDGRVRRSYLYGADLAVWLWTILVRGVSCRPYNVGSEDDRSLLDVAQLVARIGGVSVRLAESTPGGAAPPSYVPDAGRARSELGLDAWTDLETAVRKTLAFYSKTGLHETV